MHRGAIVPHGVTISDVTLQSYLGPKPPEGSKVTRSGRELTLKLNYGAIYLRLFKSPSGSSWQVNYICLDLAKILYGHTGKVIETHKHLVQALSQYNSDINAVIDESSRDRALPGIVRNCFSYWVMLEIPFHRNDPGKRILAAFNHATHTGIRKPKTMVKGETVTLEGTDLKVSAYMKDLHLKDKGYTVLSSQQDIIRIEVTFKQGKIGEYFGFGDKERLKTFSVDSLYLAYRTCLGQLRGVYHVPGTATLAKHENFIFECIQQGKVQGSVDELVKLYRECNGLKKRTQAPMRKRITEALSGASAMHLSGMFPQQAPPASPVITPYKQLKDEKGRPEGEPVLVIRKAPLVSIDDRVAKAYSSATWFQYAKFQATAIYGHGPANPQIKPGQP